MSFDTPWFIEGALHSAQVARNLTFTVLNGVQGYISPGDCLVQELETPGPEVRVAPGTVAVTAQGLADEMYLGRLPVEETVPITATDAVGGRSDLIVARVVNPAYETVPSGWGTIDPDAGPFMATYVIPGVPSTTTRVDEVDTNMSAVALARVDIPVSTATITQAMIVDLRTPAKAGVVTVPAGTPVPPGLPDGTLFVEYTP